MCPASLSHSRGIPVSSCHALLYLTQDPALSIKSKAKAKGQEAAWPGASHTRTLYSPQNTRFVCQTTGDPLSDRAGTPTLLRPVKSDAPNNGFCPMVSNMFSRSYFLTLPFCTNPFLPNDHFHILLPCPSERVYQFSTYLYRKSLSCKRKFILPLPYSNPIGSSNSRIVLLHSRIVFYTPFSYPRKFLIFR